MKIQLEKTSTIKLIAIILTIYFSSPIGLTTSFTFPVSTFAKNTNGNQKETNADRIAKEVRYYVDKGDYEKALSLLAPFLSKPLKYQQLVSDYIVILTWTEKKDQAIKLFERLPQNFRKRPYLLRNVASVYFEKGEYSKAYSLYKETIEKDPSDVEAQKGLFRSLVELKKYKDILYFLKKLPPIEDTELNIIRAYTLFKNKKYVDALTLYKGIIKKTDAEELKKTVDNLIASLEGKERKQLLKALNITAISLIIT